MSTYLWSRLSRGTTISPSSCHHGSRGRWPLPTTCSSCGPCRRALVFYHTHAYLWVNQWRLPLSAGRHPSARRCQWVLLAYCQVGLNWETYLKTPSCPSSGTLAIEHLCSPGWPWRPCSRCSPWPWFGWCSRTALLTFSSSRSHWASWRPRTLKKW